MMHSDGTMADRLTAIVLFLLGVGMAWGGFEMDRLEIRRIHPASIPGLVPMILGIIMMICAGFLAYGTMGARNDDAVERDLPEKINWADLSFTAVWSCIFALFLVGNMPFVLASGIYIAVFSAWFLWPDEGAISARIKLLVLVAFYAAVVAVGISALFQYGFLVRLP